MTHIRLSFSEPKRAYNVALQSIKKMITGLEGRGFKVIMDYPAKGGIIINISGQDKDLKKWFNQNNHARHVGQRLFERIYDSEVQEKIYD